MKLSERRQFSSTKICAGVTLFSRRLQRCQKNLQTYHVKIEEKLQEVAPIRDLCDSSVPTEKEETHSEILDIVRQFSEVCKLYEDLQKEASAKSLKQFIKSKSKIEQQFRRKLEKLFDYVEPREEDTKDLVLSLIHI
eukprot:TRINITY_DN13224_c0_g1_i1.p1 TRINITY_DN13224_c0_g1~~TRINITY_DN13224_c0_g1_i1.p1  ORF type:complete len:137 (+),score=14.85 TRINITY_DN13224_c0_g1_i1:130-540(+)